MASIFSKIVAGKIPCYKIAENENFLAFLDINPLKKGHTLVIPKKEIDEFFDLEIDLLSEIMVFAKPIAAAIKEYSKHTRVGMTVIGLEVPHAHVHLIPINGMNDMNFANKKLSLSQDEFKEIQSQLVTLINS